ncbi:hypothetical protein HKX48_001566 [Thoreauomyces humboldtii]|nr:hypothetical protein HKX48_001566 [Thoreauomyces humboldtii]
MADDHFAGQVKILQNMANEEQNRAALFKSKGKINSAIELIVSGADLTPTPEDSNHSILTSFDPLASSPQRGSAGSAPRSPQTPQIPTLKFKPLGVPEQHKIFILHQMGFRQEGKSRDALHRTKWDVEAAATLLLDKNDELDERFDCINAPAAEFAAPGGSGVGGGAGWTDLQGLGSVAWKPTQVPTPASAFHLKAPQPTPVAPYRTGPPARSDAGKPTYAPLHLPPHPGGYTPQQSVPQAQPTPPADPFEDPFGDDFRIQ